MKYDLSKIVSAGDLIFVHGTSFVSKAIQKITFGSVNHVGIVYDDKQVFETDIAWGKASLRDLEKYNSIPVVIIRPKMEYFNPNTARYLCEKYNGTPYSWWDIWNNVVFALLKDSVRKSIMTKLGTKKFAICSELSARIIYESANKYEKLAQYEGLTPQDLLEIVTSIPEDFEVVLDSISPTLHPSE